MISSLYIIATTDLFLLKEEKEVYDISVIIDDSKSDAWTGFRSGMEQAAKELNGNVSFITLYDQNNLKQQMILLRREIDDGADAILISPSDSKGFEQELRQMDIEIPIIIVGETGEENIVSAYISSDNIGEGNMLGEEIVANGEEQDSILIIKNRMQCRNITERYEGLLEILNRGSVAYRVLDLQDINEREKLAKEFENEDLNIIVTLDEMTLEWVLDEREQLGFYKEGKIYGFGYTNRILYYIEMGVVDSVIIQNTYNMGYLGIKDAIETIEKRGKKSTKVISIDSRLIRGDNMYERDNQTWLFPIS